MKAVLGHGSQESPQPGLPVVLSGCVLLTQGFLAEPWFSV